MAKKKVEKVLKLQIPAGKANPAPPIGPALGAAGVNIMAFCKEFNARTQDKAGSILPTEITVYKDKSFTFITKEEPAAEMLKKAAKIQKGSGEPNQNKVAKLTWDQLLEIGAKKMKDLNARTPEAAARIIAGTARSMGVDVEGIPAV